MSAPEMTEAEKGTVEMTREVFSFPKTVELSKDEYNKSE